MYMSMHNTTMYIDVLDKLVYNYNNAYHSGIKKIPAEVTKEDEDIIKLTKRKYNKAKLNEVIYNVGDKVRCVVNLKAFEKRSLPTWSKIVHTIVEAYEHSYKLDNGKVYRYYELQKVDNIQKLDKSPSGPTREQMKKERTVKRRFKKEGIDMSVITTAKRQRNKTDRLKY